MKTITKNDVVVEALKREIVICESAIKRYRDILKRFEKKYHLTSRQFSKRFDNGTLGDRHDFFEWYAIYDYYQNWLNRKRKLKESLV